VPLYLVRHAKAGSRQNWVGDDRIRPLSKTGRRQSEALAQRLAPLDPSHLVSSPYVRCMQTLEPLARVVGLEVRSTEDLAEGASLHAAMELLTSVPDRTVLCSHGDVIPELITGLERRGAVIATAPDWRKATTWVLERSETGREDAFTRAEVWAPPEQAVDG